MSLNEAASQVADHLQRQEFVEVYAHHDADGIAAASILCLAMLRRKMKFRLRIRSRINSGDIPPDKSVLLCDFGSGLEDLPEEVIVIDHHLPRFKGGLHVNPRIFGVDGDRELSSSGTSYLVAQKLGDNRDLAGLAMLGILGDGQELEGPNLEIFNEAVAQGIISLEKGCRLPGRDAHERLISAINPYLHQISGDEVAVADLIDGALKGENLEIDTLVSLIVLRISPYSPMKTLMDLYGDRYSLEREIIPDAHSLAAIVDACGKCGRGGLAASLCLRSPGGVAEAWETAVHHRARVVKAIRDTLQKGGKDGFFEVGDVSVASDVADALFRDCITKNPVIVSAKAKDLCYISARSPDSLSIDLGEVVREAAAESGGFGGGHRMRAGATISCSRLDQFRTRLNQVLAV
ncbi:MAG TPA: DHH family phosphoesterase [Methanoregulaceae archaeon]|nr:DHH family phosphoesterase [Methanoregulaceae archaeon]